MKCECEGENERPGLQIAKNTKKGHTVHQFVIMKLSVRLLSGNW